MRELVQALAKACKDVFNEAVEPALTRPDEQFGDYATNVALQLGKKLGKSPRETAQHITSALKSDLIAKTEVAGPGFINIWLTDEALWALATRQPQQSLKNQTVVAEYSDPNPFKVLHAGHLYTSVVGDAIARMLETAGAKVHRVNFGGDVGLHVAKTMWAILGELGGEHPDKLEKIAKEERSDWLSSRYVEGTSAYKENEKAKPEIISLNKRIYQIHADNDHNSPLAKIYWTCRTWSYDYFESFYKRLGTQFEKYYPESETAPIGLKTVQEQLKKGVFEESHGAVVFVGEKYGLHTRVFINSEGLPTYETKDVGLIIKKDEDYHFDASVIITGNDIVEYMKVVLKAIEQFKPKLAQATTHLTHGMVRLAGGQKMSSRKGNILKAVDVLDAAEIAYQKEHRENSELAVLAAVKYSFLKQRLGGDIVYSPQESVSLLGNSGPYLQYAHARARSIMAKAGSSKPKAANVELQAEERALVRKLGEYAETIDVAVQELSPHHVCTYLYDLAQEFNRFYENSKVIGDPREAVRLQLVARYAETLKNGLEVLNISAPEKM